LLAITLSPTLAQAAPGDLDTGFDSDGKMTWKSLAEWGKEGAIQPDGKIVVVGSSNGSCSKQHSWIARFNANGSLDTSFSDGDGTDGSLRIVRGTCLASDYSDVVIEPDGGIIALGTWIYAGNLHFIVAERYTADGDLNTSWGSSGSWTAGSYDLADVDVDQDGKLLVTGTQFAKSGSTFYYKYAAWRLTTSGGGDSSFDSDGHVLLSGASADICDIATSGAIDGNGHILIAGNTCSSRSGNTLNGLKTHLVELSDSGSLVNAFDSDGRLSDTSGPLNPQVMSRGQDKLLVAGDRSSDLGLDRYDTDDGSLDTAFGSSGRTTTDTGGSYLDVIADINEFPGGEIILGATTWAASKDFGITVHNADGSLATDFSGDGKVITPMLTNENDLFGGILVDADHKLVAVGRSSSYAALARYHGVPPIEVEYDPLLSVRDGLSPEDELAEQPMVSGLRSGEDLEYSIWPPLPSGIELNDETGEITGSYTGTALTVNSIRDSYAVLATSNYGREVEASFDLQVLPPEPEQQFRPILRFDSEETWRPLEIDSFLGEGSHYWCEEINNAPDACSVMNSGLDDLRVQGGSESEAWLGEHAYLDLNGVGNEGDPETWRSPEAGCYVNEEETSNEDRLFDCDDGALSAIYYNHVAPVGDDQVFDYWFY